MAAFAPMYFAVASRVLPGTNHDDRTRGLLAMRLRRTGFECAAGDVVDTVRRAVVHRRPLLAARHLSSALRAEIARARGEMLTRIASVEPRLAHTALMTLLASRSPDTYQHALRVGTTSAALARALGVALDQIPDIRRAALLHDIGKAAVPARILGLRGRPSEDEVLALRLHVTIGEEVLATVPALGTIAMMVGATHERLDGGGYPHGLSGADIPLGSRIIAVADVYDAMTSIRPYRSPLTHDEANRDLARVAGTQLDPDVVTAWIRLTGARPC